MRLTGLKCFAAISCIFLLAGSVHAQNGFAFTCNRDTIIPGCNPACFTLKGIIPDIYSLTGSYTTGPTSTTPGCTPIYVQPDDPVGTPTSLIIDDRYSTVINIGFPFPFFGATYTQLIASTNGYISFDISKASGTAHWTINNDLPSASYDRAMIMGPYHDLDPSVGTSPTQRIQYQTFGTAPHRRWVLSFYRVPLYSAACNSLIENTHQIVLYESTGVFEVIIFSKQICPGWNTGRAIVGAQDWNRTTGFMAPGRAAIANPPWSVSNGSTESWRAQPSGGASLFKRVELCDLAGTILSTGTTIPAGTGRLEASFPNTCVPAVGLTTYIIRSVYTKIDDPLAEVFGTDTVRVTRASAVTATTSTTATLCSGATDGSIVINPTSGTPPYTYSLDGATGVTGPSPYTFNNVTAGPHTVDITDANGCTLSLNVDVAAGPAMTTTVSKTDALCNSTATGTITVTPPTIGTPPYQYSLDGVSWQAGNVFNGLIAGNYTVYYRSSDICPGNTNVTITEPAALSASSVNTNGTCDGGPDGTITITAGGGTPGYQYSLNGISYQPSNVFNVVPGNYTVSVKDNNACINTFNAVVGLNNNLTFSPQADDTICEGTSTQLALTTNATGFAWSPPAGLSDTAIYNPVADPVITTQYVVRATLGVCFITDTVIVNVYTAPVPDAGAPGFICYGQTYQLQGSGGTQYSWSPVTYLDNPLISNPTSSAPKDMTYTLSILSDINGCASLVTDQVRLDVTPPIKVKTYPYDSVAYSGDKFRLFAVASDTDVINYTWVPATGLSNASVPDPIVTAGVTGDVTHYEVTTSTIAGCIGKGYVTVRVYKGPDIYVPTGFTPNSDGKNDKFTPFPVGIKSYKYFRVFNRWGQMVFSTSGLNDGWDGKFDGREQITGTYIWMIEGITKDDKVITKKGTVTLMR